MKTVTDPLARSRVASPVRRAFLLTVGIAALALGACASDPAGSSGDTGTSSPGMPAYDASGDEPSAAPAADTPPVGQSITLPKTAMDGLDAFLNRRATLFADVIEVDLTRSPFLAGMTRSVNPETVEVTESHDPESGLITMVLQARGEQAPTLTTMPAVRFGDGLELIGQDRITLRFRTVQDESRPIHFQARGISTRGKAVFGYQDDIAHAVKAKSVELTAAVRRRGSSYEFSQAVGEMP